MSDIPTFVDTTDPLTGRRAYHAWADGRTLDIFTIKGRVKADTELHAGLLAIEFRSPCGDRYMWGYAADAELELMPHQEALL